MAKVPNNMTEHPIEIYSQRFSEKDPGVMAARSGVAFDGDTKEYSLTLLGRKVKVLWPTMEALDADTGKPVDDKSRILLGRLILEGKLVPGTGKFLSYEEIPNGSAYYEPFHGRCIMRLAYMFKSAEQFSKACEAFGATSVQSVADAAFEFEFLEGLRIRLLYWEADEEFGPNSQFLFSDDFLLAFTSDDIACSGDIILGALKRFRS